MQISGHFTFLKELRLQVQKNFDFSLTILIASCMSFCLELPKQWQPPILAGCLLFHTLTPIRPVVKVLENFH